MDRHMGNEDKVKDLTRVAKDVFLQDAARIEADKPKLYDLEEEFARTRANRSLRTVFLVLGFIVVAVGVTVFLTLYIQNQNRRVKIDIAEFEDVTLKDLLSSVTKNESELYRAQQALADVKQEMAAKSQALKDDTAGKIAVLNAQGLSKADLDAGVKKLRAQESAGLAAIDAQYAKTIKAREADVAAVQKKMDSYDKKQLEAAKKQREVLDNQQHLHELEVAQTKAYYEAKLKEQAGRNAKDIADLKANQKRLIQAMDEKQKKDIAALILKYNPVFETAALKAILASRIDPGLSSTLADLSTRLQAGKYVGGETFAGMRDTLQKRTALYARIGKIPYLNSVPSALAHLDYFDRLLLRSHEDIAWKLAQTIQDDEAKLRAAETAIKTRDGQIGQLASVVAMDRAAFEFYARKIRENGFLLDVRDPQRIAVFLNPSYSVSDGDLGLVFRADDEYIGSIRFSTASGALSALKVELAPEKQFEPFDKFLLKKTEEGK